jgi:hypothetical protein
MIMAESASQWKMAKGSRPGGRTLITNERKLKE